ncbi:hypothetical protein MNBD_GAMMA17-490 [hydrothermal vent metagenome]|uniref:DUF3301 domain-containing protein n=1 Tax=hydrothermal vent metagenome TaxID=652676 RepID=A0A3B0ZM25_9ZZZZ
MPSFIELLLLCGVVMAAAFWWRTNELKQIAYQVARRRCDESGVQFLDDSVVLSKVRLRRNDEGRIALLCHFSFEFATVGDMRYCGELQFLGRRLSAVEMEPHKL